MNYAVVILTTMAIKPGYENIINLVIDSFKKAITPISFERFTKEAHATYKMWGRCAIVFMFENLNDAVGFLLRIQNNTHHDEPIHYVFQNQEGQISQIIAEQINKYDPDKKALVCIAAKYVEDSGLVAVFSVALNNSKLN